MGTEPTPRRAHSLEIEALRGIAICAVVALHASWHYAWRAGFDRPAGQALALIHLAAGFGVPLFFALSAAGLTLGYSQTLSVHEYLSLLRRRALRLLPAYVAWSVVSLLAMRPQALRSPVELTKALLFGAADSQFYFVPLVFQLYLVWPLLQPFARWSARSGGAAFIVAALGAATSVAWWQLSAGGWVSADWPFLLPFFFLYASLGIAAAPHLARLQGLARNRGVAAGFAAAALGALLVHYLRFLSVMRAHPNPMTALFVGTIFQGYAAVYIYCAIAALTLLALRRPNAPRGVLEALAGYSYGIFLVHFLVLRALARSPSPLAIAGTDSDASILLKAAAAALLCLLASAAFVALVGRSSRLRPLVSNRF